MAVGKKVSMYCCKTTGALSFWVYMYHSICSAKFLRIYAYDYFLLRKLLKFSWHCCCGERSQLHYPTTHQTRDPGCKVLQCLFRGRTSFNAQVFLLTFIDLYRRFYYFYYFYYRFDFLHNFATTTILLLHFLPWKKSEPMNNVCPGCQTMECPQVDRLLAFKPELINACCIPN